VFGQETSITVELCDAHDTPLHNLPEDAVAAMVSAAATADTEPLTTLLVRLTATRLFCSSWAIVLMRVVARICLNLDCAQRTMQAKVVDSIFDTELLTEGDEHVVIGWFTSEEDDAYKLYQKVLALSLLFFLFLLL
jgi:hypothetical protein